MLIRFLCIAFKAVLWIRIPRFLYLPDPDPSLFVRIRILPAKKVRKTIFRVVLDLPTSADSDNGVTVNHVGIFVRLYELLPP